MVEPGAGNLVTHSLQHSGARTCNRLYEVAVALGEGVRPGSLPRPFWRGLNNLLQGHTMRRAYTLIEVLHVIVIMSILIALCIPAMAGARQNARAVASMMNLHTLSDMMVMYTANNADEFLNPFRARWPLTPEYKGMKWTSVCVTGEPSKR